MIRFSGGFSKAVKIDQLKKKIDSLQREISALEKPEPDGRLYIYGGDIPKNILHAMSAKEDSLKLASMDLFLKHKFSYYGSCAPIESGTATWFLFATHSEAYFGTINYKTSNSPHCMQMSCNILHTDAELKINNFTVSSTI